MSHFSYRVNDIDDDNWVKVMSTNQRGGTAPLRTSMMVNDNPSLGITTATVSDVLQGSGIYKPTGIVYDRYNQSLSSDLSAFLKAGGGTDVVLGGGRTSLLPYDVLTQTLYDDGIFTRQGGGSLPGGGSDTPSPANPAAPGTVYTPEQIGDVAVEAGFRGESLVISIAVAIAESGGRVDVVNTQGLNFQTGRLEPGNGQNQVVGLWQIHPGHLRGGDPNTLKDPRINAQHAWRISTEGTRWTPAWYTYTTGAYRSHMDQARRGAGGR